MELENLGTVIFEVEMEGPSRLSYKENGTYSALLLNGSGDYKYQWYQQIGGNNDWELLGTQQTQRVIMVDRNFTLRVDVRDNRTGQEAFPIQYLEYQDSSNMKDLR